MAVNTAVSGKEWPAISYEVGREKIREYSNAVGESNPLYSEAAAARAAGFRNVVAPPMFCVVYSAASMGEAMMDDEVALNFAKLVHGEQRFEWGEPVCAGDEISTTVKLTGVSKKMSMGFYVFETESVNQDGVRTVTGIWTDIVRDV